MAQAAWEKSQSLDVQNAEDRLRARGGERLKFLIGGVLILAAVVYLIVSNTANNARFFITVDELLTDPDYIGQTVRISGAVVGETISQQDTALTFSIAHIPKETTNLAETLNLASNSPSATRLTIVYEGPRPDLLQHEAQAIVSGHLDENGVFHANELLLKCPSRFEEGGSDAVLGADHPGVSGVPGMSSSNGGGS